MIEPASIQETWLSLLRGKNFDGDACLEGLVKQTADRLDAYEARIAELTAEVSRQRETNREIAAVTNSVRSRNAELEEALKELDACMDFNEEVQPGEMGIESPENINAAFKKAAALIAQQEQAHD